MRYLPDGTQMKNADLHTINEMGIPSLVLMERAALETAAVMKEQRLDMTNVLIVCGSGNNGGDGFALARILAEKGRKPHILFAGKETSMSTECALQKSIVHKMDIPVFTEFTEGEYTVIIDAVFGVGLSRDITGYYAEVIGWMNRKNGKKVAIDIPSGVCSHTGRILGTAFRADLTVSMACVKIGCEMYPGKDFAGQTVPVPIGIDHSFFKKNKKVCCTYDREDIPKLLPVRPANSHKGTYGKVLMITGSSGMAGAAYLSASAAYAAGAGLIQIYTAENNREILQTLLPEAIISCYSEYNRNEFSRLLEWSDVICIGCGLGKSENAEQLLLHTLRFAGENDKLCIIDADGLNLLSRHMNLLKNKMSNKNPFILTPHMKEMSVLTGKTIKEIAEERVEVLEKFVEANPVVCVLKDSRTMTAENGYRTAINLRGNSAMAKAGSGDVLAGVITGLAAQGTGSYRSAVLGVLLHACAGDEARKKKGSYSVLARDLVEGISINISAVEAAVKNNNTEERV